MKTKAKEILLFCVKVVILKMLFCPESEVPQPGTAYLYYGNEIPTDIRRPDH